MGVRAWSFAFVSVFVGVVAVGVPTGAATATWRVVNSPAPVGSQSTTMTGVACPAANECVAVGYVFFPKSSGSGPLIDQWNGVRWTPSLGAPGVYGDLAGVACPSVQNCVAVGSDRSVPLIEHWNGSAWSVEPSPTPKGADSAILNSVACVSATD
ncbi:MAG TPA: hypothetical protein VGI86_05445, partial [Acidimicrobiia bacterium]